MPRVRPTQAEMNRREIISQIASGMALEGIRTKQMLAERSGIPYTTLCKRFTDPDGMTMLEAGKIARALRMQINIGG